MRLFNYAAKFPKGYIEKERKEIKMPALEFKIIPGRIKFNNAAGWLEKGVLEIYLAEEMLPTMRNHFHLLSQIIAHEIFETYFIAKQGLSREEAHKKARLEEFKFFRWLRDKARTGELWDIVPLPPVKESAPTKPSPAPVAPNKKGEVETSPSGARSSLGNALFGAGKLGLSLGMFISGQPAISPDSEKKQLLGREFIFTPAANGACEIRYDETDIDKPYTFTLTYNAKLGDNGNVDLHLKEAFDASAYQRLVIVGKGKGELYVYLRDKDSPIGAQAAKKGKLQIISFSKESKAYAIDLSQAKLNLHSLRNILLEMGSRYTKNKGGERVSIEEVYLAPAKPSPAPAKESAPAGRSPLLKGVEVPVVSPGPRMPEASEPVIQR